MRQVFGFTGSLPVTSNYPEELPVLQSDTLRAALLARFESDFDPRCAEQMSVVEEAAATILESSSQGLQLNSDLLRLESEFLTSDTAPIQLHLAVKMARSKALVAAIAEPLHVSVVFAMYKEHTRILHPDEHEHGENFLRRKLDQLHHLFDSNKWITWELIAVDDGCPKGSGKLAQKILKQSEAQHSARVLFLEEAIQSGHPMTVELESAAQSQKGGAVELGMWEAIQSDHENHLVVFTDADLSTHLGQTGLLIAEILNTGNQAAIASRREPASVVVKQGTRNTRGKLFIYLWKGLIHPLQKIVDTQCGFKAFRAECLRDILPRMVEKKFAFDVELLLATELRQPDTIAKVAVAWIDSEAASTTTELQPYLSMLQAIVKMYENYLPEHKSAGELAQFIGRLSEEDWHILAERVPEQIATHEPAEFDHYRPVSPGDLQRILDEN